MALRSARLAAADYGNGRRRCPQAHPVRQANRLAYLSRREPPETVYSGGERLSSSFEQIDWRISAPFLADFGADPGFKTPVGADFSHFRFRP